MLRKQPISSSTALSYSQLDIMTIWKVFALTAVFAVGSSATAFAKPVQASPIRLAQADACYRYIGNSASGQEVTVNLCSVSLVGDRQVDFIYYLGDEPIASRADCTKGSWTTFPERQTHLPQSQATQSMISSVCRSLAEIAVVFSPPSNVRATPNGVILCTLEATGNLSVFSSTGDWYYTDACGSFGVIHSSQIRF